MRPLREVINDEDYWSRRFALRDARKAGDVDALVRGLTDPDHRSVAADALGELAAPQAVAPLLRLLDASDSGVRASAARALGKIGSREPVERLIDIAEHDRAWAVRTWAIGALRAIGAQEVVPRLVPLLDDPNPAVRASVVRALGQLGDSSVADDLRRSRANEAWSRRRPYSRALRALQRRTTLR